MSRTFIMLMAIILAPVTYVVGSAILEPSPELKIDISQRLSDREVAVAKEWLKDFRKSCPMLFTKFREHTSDAHLDIYPEAIPYASDTYGWDRSAFFSVKISTKSEVATGHTVAYHISRSGTPGWYTQKEEGAQVCGREPSPDGDTFVQF